MSREKRKIETVTGGIVRAVIFDPDGTKYYKVETDDAYLKCTIEENEVIIIESFITEEEWN